MKEAQLKWILDNIPYVVGLSTIIAVIKFKSVKAYAPAILAYIGLAIFFEILSRTLYEKGINNLPYLHLYTALEFGIVSAFYFHSLRRSFKPKLLYAIVIVFFAFAIVNAAFFEGFYRYNAYTRALESLIIITFTLLFYFQMLDELAIQEPTASPDFWFATGFLLYFAGSFVLFTLSNILASQSKEINFIAWAMHAFLLAVLHILISVGLWKIPRQ